MRQVDSFEVAGSHLFHNLLPMTNPAITTIKGARLEYLQFQYSLPFNWSTSGILFQSRPAACLGLASDAGHFLDPGKEPLIADGLILIDGQSDIVDRFAIQFGPE